MRTIDNQWGNLAQGYEEVKRLEAKLLQDWGDLIEQARQAEFEKAITDWENRKRKFEAQNSRGYKKYLHDLSKWNVQIEAYNRSLAEWKVYQDKINRERAKLSLWVVLCGILIILLAISVLGIPFILAPVLFLLSQYRKFSSLKKKAPPQPHPPRKPAPFDYEARLGKKPSLESISAVPIDLTAKWWKGLSIQEEPGRGFGMEGVTQLLSNLSRALPDDYMAFQELLVTQHLDVDVMVIGPSGVWLLESKYWAGQVVCHKGTWYQVKDVYQQRGVADKKLTTFGIHPDDQWLREKSMVAETLRRRLPEYPWIQKYLHGGLVFTHPEVRLDIDRSCKVKWGRPEEWSQIISTSKPVSGFTEDIQLRVAEVILLFASIVDSSQPRKSAVALAQQLHSATVKEIRAYVNKWVRQYAT